MLDLLVTPRRNILFYVFLLVNFSQVFNILKLKKIQTRYAKHAQVMRETRKNDQFEKKSY